MKEEKEGRESQGNRGKEAGNNEGRKNEKEKSVKRKRREGWKNKVWKEDSVTKSKQRLQIEQEGIEGEICKEIIVLIIPFSITAI